MIKLYMAVGIPGSGKSTFIRKRVAEWGGIHISRDVIRFNVLNDNEEYFQQEDKVFNLFIHEIQTAIDNNISPIYVDATHLAEKGRNKVLNRLKLNNVELHILLFTTPLNICLERNSKREGRAYVPETTIKNMYHAMRLPSFFEKYAYESISEINEDGLFINRWVKNFKGDILEYERRFGDVEDFPIQ